MRYILSFLITGFLLFAVVESWVFLLMGEAYGATRLMVWVFLSFFLGYYTLKRQGIKMLYRIYLQLQAEVLPGVEVLEGGLIVMAGVFLMAPGFVSDLLGLLLIIPLVRRLIIKIIILFASPYWPKTRPKGYNPYEGRGVVNLDAKGNGDPSEED